MKFSTHIGYKQRYVGHCRAKCPGGQPCCLTDHPHKLHHCSDERCYCHSQAAYRERNRQLAAGRQT